MKRGDVSSSTNGEKWIKVERSNSNDTMSMFPIRIFGMYFHTDTEFVLQQDKAPPVDHTFMHESEQV